MSGCSHDCSSCGENCSSRQKDKSDFLKPMNKYSDIKKVIGVVSGKGGVGKSLVSCLLASKCAKAGLKVGILDADITGPSVPKSFGITERAMQDDECLLPAVTSDGIKLMSINLLLEDVNSPVVWRGPVISGVIEQFWSDVRWGELDYFLIDLPPGTSDIHLTMVQTLAITGAVVVSTPQEVALADARKGISMFTGDKVNVPVLGLIENMAWFTPAELPENKYYIFGKEGCKRLAEELNVPLLGQIPIVQSICEGGDQGKPVALNPDSITGKAFQELAENVVKQIDYRNEHLAPTERVIVTKK